MKKLSVAAVVGCAALFFAGCAVWQGAQDAVTSVPKTEPIKTIIEFPGNVVKSIQPEADAKTTTIPLVPVSGSVKTAQPPKEDTFRAGKPAVRPVQSAIPEDAAAGPVQKIVEVKKIVPAPVEPAVEGQPARTVVEGRSRPAAVATPEPAPVVAEPAQQAVPSAAPQKVEAAPAPVFTPQSGPTAVADFNSGKKPSNIGGDFGSWNKDPNDKTQYCNLSFDPQEKRGDAGYAVRLDYKVDSPNPAYNGFWMKLNGFNAAGCQALVFYVKGDPDKKFTSRFKVELKSKAEVGKFMVNGVTGEWQKISIPLSKLQGLTDRSALDEFVIVFDDLSCSVKTGTVYVDDISFE